MSVVLHPDATATPMSPTATRALAALLVLAPFAPLRGQHGTASDAPPRGYRATPVGDAGAAPWRADLRALVLAIETRHPTPYARTPRDSFARAVAALDARIPTLAEHEIVVGLQRIVRLVGDGHTNLNLESGQGVDFHVLPLRMASYADGVWIEAADRRHADVVGARVVAIGGVPIDSAVASVEPLVSRDNDEWVPLIAPRLLGLAEVLHALRLAPSPDRATLTVEQGGRTRTVTVTPVAATRPRAFGYPLRPRWTADWVDAADGAPAPLHARRVDEVHSWEYRPAERLLYLKWDQVQNRSEQATALGTVREAMRFARENAATIDRVVLDLRNNTGGEGGLLDPIVREIVHTPEVDAPGRFFVVTGPRTFSAALLLSVQLQRYSYATFAGEPTGGKPNVAAGHVFETLPNSRIGVSISPALYLSTGPADVRPSITPRLYARPTFADYRNGRDPVLEAILAWRGDTLGALVERLAAGADSAALERALVAYARDPLNRYAPASARVNAAGYAQLRAGRREAALAIFRTNVRLFPEYTNGWDSLGEALADAGRPEEALRAFEVVLKREPANGRAREWVARLRTHGR